MNAGVKAFFIINVFDKERNTFRDIHETFVFPEIYLLSFQGFKKGFGKGVLIRISGLRHTDLGFIGSQKVQIVLACRLDTFIGMMDETFRGFSIMQGNFKCVQCYGMTQTLG